jgi:hypothetical protein
MSIKVRHCGTAYSVHTKIIEVGMHPAEYLVSDIYFEMQFLYYYLVEKIVSQKSPNFAGTVLTIKKVCHPKAARISAQIEALPLQLL